MSTRKRPPSVQRRGELSRISNENGENALCGGDAAKKDSKPRKENIQFSGASRLELLENGKQVLRS
jgi:hypothetical protein